MTEKLGSADSITDELWIDICRVVGTNLETYGTQDCPKLDKLRNSVGKTVTNEAVDMEVTSA